MKKIKKDEELLEKNVIKKVVMNKLAIGTYGLFKKGFVYRVPEDINIQTAESFLKERAASIIE